MRTIRDVSVGVVGACGFLGSHLVNSLIEDRGCKVLGIDNLISGRREFLHKDAVFEHADITVSESYLLRLFQQYKVQYVFNLAAEPYIPVSFARPLHVFATNAVGALNVINAAQEAGCEAIGQISSAEIYGDAGGDGTHPKCLPERLHNKYLIKETDSVIPHSSYGAAKAAIDAMCQVRWREAKTPVIAIRLFNCVGERETHPYVIPEIISQVWAERQRAAHAWGMTPITGEDGPYHLTVRLGNNSFRDFQYAGDAAAMMVELLEKGQFGEVVNMGSEDGIKIYDLAKLIGRLMGQGDIAVEQDPARVRPWEIWHLCSCNDKLYSVIDYRPKVSLEEALKRTIKDFHDNGGRWCWEK